MRSIGLREALLGGLGALSVVALAYGAVAGDTWVLVAGTYAAGIVLIVWLGGRRRRRR
jgi:O-antigen/teichoic acid export membrane protein